MFSRIRRSWNVLHFVRAESPAYIQLFTRDLVAFRQEFLRTAVGLGLAAAAGLLFLAFLSTAAIVTAWSHDFRVLVAWLVCFGWALISMSGLLYARRVIKGPTPFADLSAKLLTDLQTIESELMRERD